MNRSRTWSECSTIKRKYGGNTNIATQQNASSQVNSDTVCYSCKNPLPENNMTFLVRGEELLPLCQNCYYKPKKEKLHA